MNAYVCVAALNASLHFTILGHTGSGRDPSHGLILCRASSPPYLELLPPPITPMPAGHDSLVHGSARPGARGQRCFNPEDKVTEQEGVEQEVWRD